MKHLNSLTLWIPLIVCLSLLACSEGPDEEASLAVWPGERLDPPIRGESLAPRLYADDAGGLWLSWLAVKEQGHALRFARLEDGQWSQPRTAAAGEGWFANWADTPGVRPVGDWLFAHWLVRSGPGSYDYDIHAAWSPDGGETWEEAFVLHRDGVAAEHGFLSSDILPDGRLGLAWLDGRDTVTDPSNSAPDQSHGDSDEDAGSDHHHPAGAMSLRWTELSPGQRSDEEDYDGSRLLDDRVCDCCMTATVAPGQGQARVIYRDRSDSERRDIAWREVSSEEGGEVAPDGWEIAACPVNGPAAAMSGGDLGVAWYTAADSQEVRFARARLGDGSNDADEGGFSAAQRLNKGQAIGRSALIDRSDDDSFDGANTSGGAWLAVWMEQGDEQAQLLARTINGKAMSQPRKMAPVPSGRQSGFPALARQGEDYFLAWTEADDAGERRVVVKQFSEAEKP